MFCALSIVSVTSFAQPDPQCGPDCGNSAHPCGTTECPCACIYCAGAPAPCPIDGGIGFLIAAGIGLGARRSFRQRK